MDLLPTGERPLCMLFLGGPGSDWPELRERFARAGLLVDLARDRDEAFEAFLRRGGHEAVACIGPVDVDLAETIAGLRSIDPGLLEWAFAVMPSLEELQALEHELRRLLEDRDGHIPRP